MARNVKNTDWDSTAEHRHSKLILKGCHEGRTYELLKIDKVKLGLKRGQCMAISTRLARRMIQFAEDEIKQM